MKTVLEFLDYRVSFVLRFNHFVKKIFCVSKQWITSSVIAGTAPYRLLVKSSMPKLTNWTFSVMPYNCNQACGAGASPSNFGWLEPESEANFFRWRSRSQTFWFRWHIQFVVQAICTNNAMVFSFQWTKSLWRRNLSSGSFNSRVLRFYLMPQCSHPPHWRCYQRHFSNCDWMSASYSSGQSSYHCRYPTCWPSSKRKPHCLKHALPWTLDICSIQLSPVHRMGIQGISNGDTYFCICLNSTHNNSSVHLTTTTGGLRSGRIT